MIEIRPIRPDECDELGELTVRVYEAIDATDDDYTPELRDVARRCETCDVLVAVAGDRVVGGVAYVGDTASPYANVAGEDECEIRMLAVEPNAQGQGTGERLVRECIRLAREAGKARVVLSTEDQMDAAQRLYARLGFVRTPARDWVVPPDLDLRVYVLDLR